MARPMIVLAAAAAWLLPTVSLCRAQAAADPVTVTSQKESVDDRQYTVYDYTDPATKRFRVVIPDGLRVVRGLLVNCNYAGGDSRGDWTFCAYYREFMHLHNFALVASTGDIPHARALQAFHDCLRRVSSRSSHLELVNAPYVAVGFSAGGGFASTLMTYEPEKTIAVGVLGARYNFDVFTRPGGPVGPTVAHLRIPSILITGEKERLNDPAVDGRHKADEVFVPNRPKGAEIAWMERQGIGHEYDTNRQDLLVMPLLDLAVRTRYPREGDPTRGPIRLVTIDPATGWVADNNTWHSGLVKIAPVRQFKGDLGHSSWLQDEDLAFIYRAYATYNNPIHITSPAPCGPGTPVVLPGTSVPVTVDAGGFPNWKSLTLYDGARKLGTVTAPPTQFIAANLAPGYHVFSVLGTDAAGTVRSSDPVMVVVRAAPDRGGPNRTGREATHHASGDLDHHRHRRILGSRPADAYRPD